MPKEKADKKPSHEETSEGADVAELRATSAPDLPKELARQLKEDQPEGGAKQPAEADAAPEAAAGQDNPPESRDETEKDDDPELLKNAQTNKAVDEIVSEESDELLAVEDA